LPVDDHTENSTYFDVLIIGAGAAGLYAALSLSSELKIGLITKDTLVHSASGWAQGGMAAALDLEDSPELHAQDTLKAGAGLCEPQAVEFLVHHAAEQVQHLLQMGIAFDRRGSELAFTLEAAHSRPRVLHAADTTGRELVSTLAAQVNKRPNIEILSETLTLNLWIDSPTQSCQGVCVMHRQTIHWVRSHLVVLATGGGGQVFAETTNPLLSTGDGVAMVWRAGGLLRDLEFVQFHPTALKVTGAPRFLISEAVRGEGAHLVDATGRRFVFDYDPAGELAPRDIVSRSVYRHLLQHPQSEQVWLDLRPIPPERIRLRFPKIIEVCQQWGIDVFTQPIPVAPAAHYWMGGVVTDLQGATSISGLYAVGEVASTGVHGANRLASNSLLECLVFASQLAQIDLPHCSPSFFPETDQITDSSLRDRWLEVTQDWPTQQAQIQTIRHQLPQLVWQTAGICRQGKIMQTAIAKISHWRQVFQQLAISHILLNLQPGQGGQVPIPEADSNIRLWVETQNLLNIAELILKSSTFREESRGGHYRLDYPHTKKNWQAHTLVQNQDWTKAP
jgi:L-aspartate oxidase